MAEFNPEDFKDNEDFQSYIQGQLEPLTKTKEGLLADITKLKTHVKQYEGVDLQALQEAQNKLQEIEQQKHSKETEVEKQLRITREQLDKTLGRVDALETKNNALLVNDGLRSQLVAVNVKPVLMDFAMKVIKPDISIVEEEGRPIAMVGGKDLATYVTDWAETEAGKNFIAAAVNSGGGGGGGGDAPSQSSHSKFFNKKDPSYNISEQIKLKKVNPNLYATLTKMYGLT